MLDTARAFLDTPYVWGGMTEEGIDCSGLTQIAYRVHGYTIPRDADEQFGRWSARSRRTSYSRATCCSSVRRPIG